MSLMVVALVPVTSVFWSGFKAAGTSSHRTDAFAVAAREIEGMHADPYGLVGFYGDQAAAAWKATSTVSLGPCSTTCTQPLAPLILPLGTTVLSGVTYAIARYVYWADTQGPNTAGTPTTFTQAYKAITVTVNWSDAVGSHAVEQDSVIYPGGRGVYTGPGGSSATTTTIAPLLVPGTPTLALAGSQPSSPLNQQEIDVVIGAPTSGGAVSAYFVQWSADPAFAAPSQSPQLPPTSTSYAAQGLAAGITYYLRTFASNSTGQSGYSGAVSATTASVPVTTTVAPTTTVPSTTTTTLPCSPGGFTITTATTGKTYLDNQGEMSENFVLGLAVGPCLWVVTVQSVLHGTSTADPSSPYLLSGPITGGQWSDTVAASGQAGWSVGIHDMTVVIGGTSSSVTHGLLVCGWTPPGQRSSSSTDC